MASSADYQDQISAQQQKIDTIQAQLQSKQQELMSLQSQLAQEQSVLAGLTQRMSDALQQEQKQGMQNNNQANSLF